MKSFRLRSVLVAVLASTATACVWACPVWFFKPCFAALALIGWYSAVFLWRESNAA